jgi:hypothetical protein
MRSIILFIGLFFVAAMHVSAADFVKSDAFSCSADVVAQAKKFNFPDVDTFYVSGTNTLLDHERYQRYRNDVSELDALLDNFARCANAFSSGGEDEDAHVVINAINVLVDKGGIRGERSNFQAHVTGMFFGMGLASAYAQVRIGCAQDSRCDRITDWFESEARDSYLFFSGKEKEKNNLLFWVSTYAIIVGRLSGDDFLLSGGLRGVDEGLATIGSIGIPSESRGRRTVFYNQYALAALSWGLAFQGRKQLESAYQNKLPLRKMINELLESGNTKVGADGEREGQDGTKYPAWCTPWMEAGLLPCSSVKGASNFNRILGGDPKVMLSSYWSSFDVSHSN